MKRKSDRVLEAGAKILVLSAHARSLTNFRGPLLRALVKAGLQVHAAAPGLQANEPVAAQLSSWGIQCHDIRLSRTSLNVIEDLATILSVRRLCMAIKPDAVLSYNVKPVIYGAFGAKLAGVPSYYALITGLGYAFGDIKTFKSRAIFHVTRMLYGLALRWTDVVFFQNPDDENLFHKLGLLKRSKSYVVNGSGVDLRQFAFSEPPSGPPRFLMLCRLLVSKGVRDYAAAARAVRARYPEASFHLAGDIDNNPDAITREELDGWVAAGDVIYLGRLADVRSALAEASAFVLPTTYREGTPRSVLEAMAIGRAIVTTDAPGCRETVRDGLNGYLIPPRDVDALVEALVRIADDPEHTAEMGRESRKVAELRYDVNLVNKAMMSAMGIQGSEADGE